MIYKKFDKNNISLARITAQKALDKLGEEMGCKIQLGRITYGDFEMRSKIVITVDNPEVQSRLKPIFPTGIYEGKQVMYGGIQYTVTGFKPSSRKYPVVVKRNKDGRGFRLTLSAVK